MPDTRPMAGAERGAKPHNPPTSCEISRHHADNMRKPPARGDGFRPVSLSTPCRKTGSCRTVTVPDAMLPRNFAPRFCTGTGTTLSPFPVDNSVNSALFPFTGNDLHPLPVKRAKRAYGASAPVLWHIARISVAVPSRSCIRYAIHFAPAIRKNSLF